MQTQASLTTWAWDGNFAAQRNQSSLGNVMPKKMNDIDRVMRHVKKTDDGHWIWQGSRCGGNREYGQVKYQNKTSIAHRVVWMLLRGQIPTGLDLLHQCGQTLCVNPDHLRIGTHKENHEEAVAVRGGVHWHKGRDMVGDKNPKCRIPDSEVPKIIKANSSGQSRKSLAARYGVAVSTIDKIVTGSRRTRS